MSETEIQDAAAGATEAVKTADVVLGVPTFNHAETIAPLIRRAGNSLQEGFPGLHCLIVHADGGSQDRTVAQATEAAGGEGLVQIKYPMVPAEMLSTPYHGLPGRAGAFRSILSAAQQLGARACAILDANRVDGATHAIRGLLKPVLDEDFDFVSPRYDYPKFHGTILKGLVYPFFRALYGRQIRQPLANEFGFSARLVEGLLRRETWDNEGVRQGTDIWMTGAAIRDGLRVCETAMGEEAPKPTEAMDLGTVLSQILGPLFGEIERDAAFWQKVRASVPVKLFGSETPNHRDAPVPGTKRMLEAFRLGEKSLMEVWSAILPPTTLLDLRKLARSPDERFSMPDEVWAHTVFDFALAHRLRRVNREHLLQALVPVYLGWVASYVFQVGSASAEEAEARIERLCRVFEAEKRYLISRWRWPDRFSP